MAVVAQVKDMAHGPLVIYVFELTYTTLGNFYQLSNEVLDM